MSAFARQSAPSGIGSGWQPDVMRLLDEHHLAAWSNHARLRLDFATSLGRFLAAQTDTEVCNFYGRYITNLDSFCHQLERLLTGPTLDRRIDGPRGVTSLLRAHEPVGPAPPSRFRFYIWHDADVLLDSDRGLFGRLVDAIAGVAAEAEYASDDLLLIHRSVFVGTEALDAYAGDVTGQFSRWMPDGFDQPFWEVVTGLPAPRFLRFAVDTLSVMHPSR
ncbi:MAG: hypothetical protein IID31_04985 [Planctomycetes bacterium]|nr:hypothetical protein [Planctomycetota bacterium]